MPEGSLILLLVVLAGGLLVLPWIALAMALRLRRRCADLEQEVGILRLIVRRLEQRSAAPSAESGPRQEGATERAGAPSPPAPERAERAEAGPEATAEESAAPAGAAPAGAERAQRLAEAIHGRPETASEPSPDHSPPKAEGQATPAAPPGRQGAAAPPRQTPRRSLEELFGTKGFVWFGALALALAGVFLVRYFAEQGLLGPAVRVSLAGGFGLLMLGGGEWLRTRQPGPRSESGAGPRPELPGAGIAQGLSAAGVAVLYAALLAAVNLHALLGPTVGFILMLAITAAAVLLSLRHGPLVALLGLVGGFVMPGLLGAQQASTLQLFGYLLLLVVGLAVLTRGRRWWWLTLLTMLGAFFWAGLWLALWYEPAERTWVALFLLASIGLFIGMTIDVTDERIGEWRVADVLPWLAALLGLALVAWLAGGGGFHTMDWAYLGLLGAGCIVLGRLRPRYMPLAALSSGMGLVLLVIWAAGGDMLGSRFNWVALAFGLLYGGGAYAAMWGSAQARWWARLSAASAIAYLLVDYHFAEATLSRLPWWAICLILGGVYTAGAAAVWRRRQRMGEATLAALAIGASGFFILAIPMELERQWISVSWALQAAAIIWIASPLKLRELRWAGMTLAAAVAVRLLLNPMVLEYPIGEHWLWNWLLYGYGAPLAAFAAAAWRLQRDREPALAAWMEVGAAAFGFALLTLLIHHGFHPDDMTRFDIALFEFGTYAVVWIAAGLALMAVTLRRSRPALLLGGYTVAALGVMTALFGPGLTVNPLWSHEPVGGRAVLNGLLYLYGLPAVAAGLGVRLFQRHGSREMALLMALAALVLVFGLVTLEVRQAFHGTYLDGPAPSNAEWYAYSAVWIVFGAALLVLGVARRSHLLRYASLVVMIVSVGKVFAFDTRHLEDLWRVISFLGLGASLLLLAWVYQRFVFGRERD